jgi:hypothetical protein
MYSGGIATHRRGKGNKHNRRESRWSDSADAYSLADAGHYSNRFDCYW